MGGMWLKERQGGDGKAVRSQEDSTTGFQTQLQRVFWFVIGASFKPNLCTLGQDSTVNRSVVKEENKCCELMLLMQPRAGWEQICLCDVAGRRYTRGRGLVDWTIYRG